MSSTTHRSCRQENEAHRADVAVATAAEPHGEVPDVGLARLGVVHDHEEAAIAATGDEIVERLPSLPHDALVERGRRIEEAGRPAVLTQLGCDFDHEARLAETARPMQEAGGGGADAVAAPCEQAGLQAGHIRIGDDHGPRLQQLDR